MDKSCQSSGDSSIRDQNLKHLNKLSHKISKPPITTSTTTIKKQPSFDHQTFDNTHQNQPSQSQQAQQHQHQQHQPPVYNINKNDFRDVVQKLTGSPAHERFSTPPPIHAPKPQSSRLQRIRPPPLAHVSNRPPPLLNSAIAPPPQPPPPPPQQLNAIPSAPTNTFIQRSTAPLSPLPPFPAVHAAAESPVSAYMRYLQNTMSAVDSNKQFSGFTPLAQLVSPRWNNLATPHQQQFALQQQQQEGTNPLQTSVMVASQPQFQLPTSPLPFGCLNSPRSPYALLSPSLLLSPSSIPLSPTVPVPSPRWRGL